MMLGGVGVIGPIRDKLGNRVAICALLVLTSAGLATVYVFNQQNKYGFSAYLMCFLWGLQDAGVNCLMNCILGFEFESKSIPFSVFKFVQSLGIFIFCEISGVVMGSKLDTK